MILPKSVGRDACWALGHQRPAISPWNWPDHIEAGNANLHLPDAGISAALDVPKAHDDWIISSGVVDSLHAHSSPWRQ